MDDIAIRLGWVAINASRVEVVVGYLQVIHGADEGDVLGAPWSSNVGACKRLYRQLQADAIEAEDSAREQNCRLFICLLAELDSWMQDRHHVLHAIWAQDETADPGETLGLRLRRRRTTGVWPVERLDALNRYLVDAHTMIKFEMERVLRRQAE